MKRVIIIGAGNIGREALAFLGTELVECFADNGKKGQKLLEKRIIPVEDLAFIKEKFIFLLAMIDCAYELKQQLAGLGIEYYYHFDGSIYFFSGIRRWDQDGVYRECSLWDYYENFGLNDSVIIGGKSKYAEFLSGIFEIGILTKENYSENTINKTKYLLNIDDRQSNDFVEEHDGIMREDVFILPQLEDRGITQKHKKLEVFKNKHKGQRCFIIGNGPSLQTDDLEKLRQNNEISFGLNVIHKLYTQTSWRPDYVCMTDPLVIAQNYQNIKDNNRCPKIVNDIKLFYYHETDENEYLVHELTDKVGFSGDFSNGYYSGATVTYAVMQLCAYMGFGKIYLLGMDCSNWGSHFNTEYWQEGEKFRAPDELKIFKAYQEAERYSKEYGFRIFNATRGGKLEIYERVDFDSLFPCG